MNVLAVSTEPLTVRQEDTRGKDRANVNVLAVNAEKPTVRYEDTRDKYTAGAPAV